MINKTLKSGNLMAVPAIVCEISDKKDCSKVVKLLTFKYPLLSKNYLKRVRQNKTKNGGVVFFKTSKNLNNFKLNY